MPAFPSYAKIVIAGYAEETDVGMLRTDMDGGLAKQRPRWSAIVKRDVTILVLSLEDRLAFNHWMRDEINLGSGWFDWRDLDGVIKQARLVGGKVRWTTPGVVWIGQAQLETVG